MSALTEKEILKHIYTIRGRRVMLDRDLAELYQVETKALNRAVKRNEKRFPEDFMFQMTVEELEDWRCKFGTSNPAIKMGLRRQPYLFTQEGVAMLSSVLNSDRAIAVNIQIMRAFIQVREMLSSSKGMVQQLNKMEDKLLKQDKEIKQHTKQIKMIFGAIRQLLEPTEKPTRKIGFRSKT